MKPDSPSHHDGQNERFAPAESPLVGQLSRRRFLALTAVSGAGLGLQPGFSPESVAASQAAPSEWPGDYLTAPEAFRTFVREKPPIDQFTPEERRRVGLDSDAWQLEIVAEGASRLSRPFSREGQTALNWAELLRLGQTKAVRFLHVLTCTNVADTFGVGLWEGVPLRELIWLARPSNNVRRVQYWGYHNQDPKQRFLSSLPIGRVLEEPPGELPVILCYKLNGQWLTPKNGGPVRLFVPGVYGNKSVKWLQRIELTDRFQANDTYAEWNNDVESALKTQARFLDLPAQLRRGDPLTLLGYAQVGVSGLRQVQYAITPVTADSSPPASEVWKDAELCGPPKRLGGGLPEGELVPLPLQYDPQTKQPRTWPLCYTLIHWRAKVPDLAPGTYRLTCRSIDANGLAQPMPRPFPRSGNNALHEKKLVVTA